MGIILTVILIVVLLVIAIYISLQKKEEVEIEPVPSIHTSGIYSVIRKSPRDNVHPAKPTKEAIMGLVSTLEKDVNGEQLTDNDKNRAVESYAEVLEKSIQVVETGDLNGIQRFIIEPDVRCKESIPFSQKKFFVTREDLYRHPELLPPYFAGCMCKLVPDPSVVPLSDVEHLRINEVAFTLPNWRVVRKISN